jgi:PAS domain S-box-containing protein
MRDAVKTKKQLISELEETHQHLAELEVSETERKKAEHELQTILKTALDSFWRTDLEVKFLEVNDSFCKMTGYTREELLKMSTQEIEAVDSPEEIAQRIKKIVEQGSDWFETRHKRKDGNIIDVEVSVNYLDVGEGQFFVFARDITQRKRAEEALKESDEFSTSLLENAPNPITVVNPDTSVKYVNPAFEKLTGFSLAEIAGTKAPYPWWPEDKKQKRLAGLKNFMAGGSKITEQIIQNKDGKRLSIELNMVRIMHNGEFKYYLAHWKDITELKRAEEALKESEEKYRDLLDNTNELIQSVTPDGRFRYVNNGWKQALGYSDEEIANLSVFNIVHPDCLGYYRMIFEKIKAGEDVGQVKATFVSKNGTKIMVEGNFTCKFVNGELVYTRSILRDVTKNKYLEEQMFRLSSAVSMSTDCIVITDFDAKIIDINQKTLEMYGGDSRDELLGRHFLELIAPAEREMVNMDVGEIIGKGSLECREYNMLSKQGRECPVQMSTSLVRDADGKPMGMVRVGKELNKLN